MTKKCITKEDLKVAGLLKLKSKSLAEKKDAFEKELAEVLPLFGTIEKEVNKVCKKLYINYYDTSGYGHWIDYETVYDKAIDNYRKCIYNKLRDRHLIAIDVKTFFEENCYLEGIYYTFYSRDTFYSRGNTQTIEQVLRCEPQSLYNLYRDFHDSLPILKKILAQYEKKYGAKK